MLDGPSYRQVVRDVYVAADVPDTLETRCDGLRLGLPDSAAFSHVTAARLYSAPVEPGLEVHVSVRAGTTVPDRHDWVHPHEGLDPLSVTSWHGRPLTNPELTWLQLATSTEVDGLVAVGDFFLRRTDASPASMAAAVAASGRRRGVVRAREALPLLRERVDSPMETKLRLLIVHAGLPCPETGLDAFDEWGGWFARPDLSYPAYRIAIEYEGDHHRTDRAQWMRDVARDDLYDQHGWALLKFTADDVLRIPYRVPQRVEDKLRAAGWRP